MFNAMIGDGDTVISNSWSQCEDQTSQADAQAIDSILAQAAASGITVINGSGDTGSTCLDGAANTVGVPADSPNATAVGGSSATGTTGGLYASETWWNGVASTPPTGSGGYGVSKYFSRPTYQSGFTSATSRSVPDLVLPVDPALNGWPICEADNGGCPNGSLYGGTSVAAPMLAGAVADIAAGAGHNLGLLNNSIYPLSGTSSFHGPSALSSDFAHVGLGSPNFDKLYLALTGTSVGPVSATTSSLGDLAGSSVPADGTSQEALVAALDDAARNFVSGKTVALTANPGCNAVVSPPSGTSDTESGEVAFTVTDAVAETCTFTATDTTDSISIGSPQTTTFTPPSATSGSIVATPSTVANDGTSPATLTVTLQNAKSQGAEGKTIALSASSGDAQVTPTGTTPGVTDSNGVATFTATDTQAETVTFTAVDTSDGNLPVPGSAAVTYSGDVASSCNAGTPTGENGVTVSAFATGLPVGAQGFNSCEGSFGLAFDGNGNLYVDDQFNGNLYKIPPSGGAATSTNQLGNVLNPGAYDLSVGTDGELYGLMPDRHQR